MSTPCLNYLYDTPIDMFSNVKIAQKKPFLATFYTKAKLSCNVVNSPQGKKKSKKFSGIPAELRLSSPVYQVKFPARVSHLTSLHTRRPNSGPADQGCPIGKLRRQVIGHIGNRCGAKRNPSESLLRGFLLVR
jgi:hypothetical protein